MVDVIISSILQLLVFCLIPLIVFLIKYRSKYNFFDFIGLKRSNRKANLYGLLVALFLGSPMLILTYLNQDFFEIMTSAGSVTGEIRALGLSSLSITTIIFTAVIKTSLAEEIFFRGFVAKRLIAIIGFKAGNSVQAIFFGAIHTLLFTTISDNIIFLSVIFIFPALGAYLKTYINEKMANGSIIPGWIAHGTGNLIAYSSVAFLF